MLPPAFSASACIILLGLNEPTQPLLLSSPACRGMPPPDFLTMPGFPYRRLSGDLVEGVPQAPPQNEGLCRVFRARGHIHPSTAPPAAS